MTRFVSTRPVHVRHDPRQAQVTALAGLPDVCRQYRRAVRAGITCPAEVLWTPAMATWVREKKMVVEARSSAELSLALSLGIAPSRIIMHCDGAQAGPIRCGINARVGQFVVDSVWQVDVLAHYARDRQRVLVDVSNPQANDPVRGVLATDRLELVGLHRHVSDADSYPRAIAGMFEQMAEIRDERGILLTRLSLAGAVSATPQQLGADIEDALDDGCACYRLPRPGVTLALLWPVVRPG